MKLNWGNYIFIFILLFLTLCTVFIIFAVRQNNDLVNDNYYELGAGYSEQIEINNRSEYYSDSIEIRMDSDNIIIGLASAISANTTSVSTYFYRPSGKEDDYRGEFMINGDSVVIEKKRLARGRYILNINWTINGESYLVKKELFLE
jgi:hypothetical protein